jgi:hypothetical protein
MSVYDYFKMYFHFIFQLLETGHTLGAIEWSGHIGHQHFGGYGRQVEKNVVCNLALKLIDVFNK